MIKNLCKHFLHGCRTGKNGRDKADEDKHDEEGKVSFFDAGFRDEFPLLKCKKTENNFNTFSYQDEA
jgi:hypothetical protein